MGVGSSCCRGPGAVDISGNSGGNGGNVAKWGPVVGEIGPLIKLHQTLGESSSHQ